MECQSFTNRINLTSVPTGSLLDLSYVSSYIKAFYFGEEDLKQWIKQNKVRFDCHHIILLFAECV